jgi:outer membrane protein assembly factor BamB
LYAINPDGTEKWTFDFGEDRRSHMSCPAISADGTIYIGIILGTPGYSDGGEIVAVNPDGTEKWRKWIATHKVQSSPCIGEDGTVYIGSSSYVEGKAYSYGYLYAFNELDPDAPEAPTITGETNGQPGEEYDW